VQYWHSGEPPERVAELLASFRTRNPDLRHEVFDEAGAERLIGEHFGARELAAFRACAVPAMQADYFRCCAILAHGGVYADADLLCKGPLAPLLASIEVGEVYGWPQMPDVFAYLGISEEALFGPVDRVGRYRWVENSFFAFRSPGHPGLALALEMMTAHVESRLSESVFATTGPGIFTSLYLLRELGSFDAFLAHAGHGVLAPVARLSCEVVGEHERLAAALNGLRIAPVSKSRRWVGYRMAPYKRTEMHWLRWPGSIFR
jgi:hypothetical protein